jgi:hypothetical protein
METRRIPVKKETYDKLRSKKARIQSKTTEVVTWDIFLIKYLKAC